MSKTTKSDIYGKIFIAVYIASLFLFWYLNSIIEMIVTAFNINSTFLREFINLALTIVVSILVALLWCWLTIKSCFLD